MRKTPTTASQSTLRFRRIPRGSMASTWHLLIYHDYLTFSDNVNHSELISTIHVVYLNSTYEFLNEAMLVRHVGSSTGAPGVFHTPAFYTQFSQV